MDKKHQKCPKNGGFPPFATPQDFFQKSGSVTFVPLWCTNFMQKIRKILRAVSEIFKDGRTNGPTDGRKDMGDYIGPSRVNPGSKMIIPLSDKNSAGKISENLVWCIT